MNFVVVGAGAWGTAIALHLARGGQEVSLVPRRVEHAAELARTRQNLEYLPGVALPESVAITADLSPALREADVILLACPAQALRTTCERIRSVLSETSRTRLVVSLAKGLELGTHLRPSEVITETLRDAPTSSLTGPTNALGVARGDPSAMVLAAPSISQHVQGVQAAVSSATLRVYTSDDLPGVEFGRLPEKHLRDCGGLLRRTETG